jgi:crossover junction endodeoxyribonuclease RuvC
MRILGIDPGSRLAGYGCIQVELEPAAQSERPARSYPALANGVALPAAGRSSLRLLACGVLRIGTSRDSLVERLGRLGAGIDHLLALHRPQVLALEEAFFGKSVQSALRVGEARGVALLCGARGGLQVAEYPPATIKQAVTGSGAASKERVAAMVLWFLGQSKTATPLDATDALAAALCHHFVASAPRLGALGQVPAIEGSRPRNRRSHGENPCAPS